MEIAEKAVRLGELVDQMRTDPLARIMNGSRELFHSNLLAWLCETFDAAVGSVFDQLVPSPVSGIADGARVQRERQNLDLYISWPDRPPTAIENKVFSIPGTDQLDRYAEKLHRSGVADAGVRAMLLSLIDPGWSTHNSPGAGGIVWHYVSYGQLAQALDTALNAVAISGTFAHETARRYVDLIQRLQDIANLIRFESESEPVFVDAWTEGVRDKQLSTALSKLRAKMVQNYLQGHVPNIDPRCKWGAGMSNATPVVEAYFSQGNTKRSHRYGWQIQGDQLRLFAVLPDLAGRTAGLRSRRDEWGRQHSEVVSFDRILPLFGDQFREVFPKKRDFNRFDPDFVYKYINVPGITVGQLMGVARQRQTDMIALKALVRTPDVDAAASLDP